MKIGFPSISKMGGAQVLDQLRVRRAVIMGHSMVGRTAAGLAAREPDRASAAVLIGAAVGEQLRRFQHTDAGEESRSKPFPS